LGPPYQQEKLEMDFLDSGIRRFMTYTFLLLICMEI